jgi:hypothetical protein
LKETIDGMGACIERLRLHMTLMEHKNKSDKLPGDDEP